MTLTPPLILGQACPNPECWPPESSFPVQVHGQAALYRHHCGWEWTSRLGGWFPEAAGPGLERKEAA